MSLFLEQERVVAPSDGFSHESISPLIFFCFFENDSRVLGPKVRTEPFHPHLQREASEEEVLLAEEALANRVVVAEVVVAVVAVETIVATITIEIAIATTETTTITTMVVVVVVVAAEVAVEVEEVVVAEEAVGDATIIMEEVAAVETTMAASTSRTFSSSKKMGPEATPPKRPSNEFPPEHSWRPV
jgi:hypothetical protein